jgi:hypothetical protein
MRRLWAGALAGLLLAVTAAAGPASACGCGAVLPTAGTTAGTTSGAGAESAIISAANGVQTIDLSLEFDAAAPSAGLLVPTPSPATVTAGDPALFDALARQTNPTPHYVDDWWGAVEPLGDGEPEVLSRVRIGDVEATTLAASDSAGLGGWLAANGYEIAPETAAVIGDYVAKRWFFVAVKLVNDSSLDGTLEPIRIAFPSSSLVYPVGMARAIAGEQAMRLSVFGEHRIDVVRADSGDALNAAVRTVWAGPVTDATLAPLGAYLTVTDVRFEQPATQISSDIGFATAPNDDRVQPSQVVVRPIELLGFPLGSLLVVWGALGLLCALGAVIARSRLR